MEKQKPKKEKAPSFDGGSPFSQTDAQHATVCCGVYQEKLPVAGKTIGEIRDEFSDRLEIASNAVATVAGVEQGNDYRVGANEFILFIQQAGEKGAHELRIVFPTADAKMRFAIWMCDGGGEQGYFDTMEESNTPSLNIDYHTGGGFINNDTILVEEIKE